MTEAERQEIRRERRLDLDDTDRLDAIHDMGLVFHDGNWVEPPDSPDEDQEDPDE
jgi:hypothetical protein